MNDDVTFGQWPMMQHILVASVSSSEHDKEPSVCVRPLSEASRWVCSTSSTFFIDQRVQNEEEFVWWHCFCCGDSVMTAVSQRKDIYLLHLL